MEHYRLHFLDHRNRIVSVLSFHAADDDNAIDYGSSFVDGRDIEIYQRARLIMRLPAFYDERQKRA